MTFLTVGILVQVLFGGAVLIVSTLKVLFWDLGASSSVQKIVFLLIFGSVTLVIAKIRSSKSLGTGLDANSDNVIYDEDEKNEINC